MDRKTGCLRGFGFITITNPHAAHAAIRHMHNMELHGQTITVRRAFPRISTYDEYNHNHGDAGTSGKYIYCNSTSRKYGNNKDHSSYFGPCEDCYDGGDNANDKCKNNNRTGSYFPLTLIAMVKTEITVVSIVAILGTQPRDAAIQETVNLITTTLIIMADPTFLTTVSRRVTMLTNRENAVVTTEAIKASIVVALVIVPMQKGHNHLIHLIIEIMISLVMTILQFIATVRILVILYLSVQI